MEVFGDFEVGDRRRPWQLRGGVVEKEVECGGARVMNGF